MGKGRYKIKMNIGDFIYQGNSYISESDQLIFASNKVTNKNTVPVETALTVYSGFRTATMTKFATNLFDNNLQKISSLKMSITKKIPDADNGSDTIVTREYNFDKLDSNSDLFQFVDWKEQKDKNELKTSIDPVQCATAVHTVGVNGYNQIDFTATGTVSIYDEYDNFVLSGTELLNKVSNFIPYAASIDQDNDETVNLALNGVLLVPSKVNSTIQILRDCSVQDGLGSNYNYESLPVLGDFGYLPAIADNINF